MAPAPSRKRKSAASRISRSKKKYWRKGADVAEIEESAVQVQQEKDDGGLISERADDDLFQVDRVARPVDTGKKFTKRQQAALNKISLLASREEAPTLPTFPKKPSKPIERLPRHPIEVKRSAPKKKAEAYDVWNTELDKKVDHVHEAAQNGAAFYLKQTKKVLPKMPSTLRVKPSLLKAVEVPDAGASYNPDVQEYTEYVAKIAEDELKVEAKEAKTKKQLQLAPGSSYATQQDVLNEVMAGLQDEPEDGNDDVKKSKGSKDGEQAESFLKGPVEVRLKTQQQRRKQQEVKKREKARLAAKSREKVESGVFRSKKMLKLLAEKEKERVDRMEKRSKKKAFAEVTERKKLGRGKYEEAEDPFLLAEEITGSLRQLKPQGDLLTDRMKSLQKRNIIPIAGERNGRRLKEKLRFKRKENRAHKEVALGTKTI